MNGNFEYDKGAYPYTSTRYGDSYFIVHTPTAQKVLNVRFPIEAGQAVARALNVQHYAAVASGSKFKASVQAVKDIADGVVRRLCEQGRFGGVQTSQLLRLIEEA